MTVGETRGLKLILRDKAALYASYLNYTAHGGLFIPSSEVATYALGDSLILTLYLLEEAEPIILTTSVIWITPKGAQGNRVSGIGVQFMDNNAAGLRLKIDHYLAGSLASDKATHTM